MPSLLPLLLSGLIVIFGSAVEAASGYGTAVIELPVLAVLFPSHMPALIVLLGIPLVIAMAGVERRHIDVPVASQVSAGLLIGSLAAVPVLTAVSGRSSQLLFGCATLIALAGMMLLRGSVPRTAPRSVAAGVGSGLMGTVTGIGGVPLAVVFGGENGPAIRATLGVIYTAGAAFSVGSLLLARRLHVADLRLALLLTVPVLIGFVAGRLLLTRVSARFLRGVVLTVVAASAAFLLYSAF